MYLEFQKRSLFDDLKFQILGEFGIRSTSADSVSVGKCYLKSGENGFHPSTILYTTAFTIPAILIILSYGRIWFYMWQNNKMIKSHGSEYETFLAFLYKT